MPTYDYRCPNGHDFEHFFRKISDAQAEMQCPVCGAVGERRVSGGAGLVFKGSGFYLTDYGKNAHRKPAASGAEGAKSEGGGVGESKSEKSEKPDKSDKSDAKSEGKSETKAESKPAESKAESQPAKKSTGPAE
jgi:putative FmdB family regulatory protein